MKREVVLANEASPSYQLPSRLGHTLGPLGASQLCVVGLGRLVKSGSSSSTRRTPRVAAYVRIYTLTAEDHTCFDDLETIEK